MPEFNPIAMMSHPRGNGGGGGGGDAAVGRTTASASEDTDEVRAIDLVGDRIQIDMD